MRHQIFSALLCMGVATPAMADCDTDIKSNDTYKDLSEKLKCLSAEIKDLKKIVFPKGSSAPAAKFVDGLTLENGGVRFELERCKSSGTEISCNIFITSLGKDQNITFNSNSRVVDQNGVLYDWNGYQGVGESERQRGYSQRWFVGDIRTAAQFVFSTKTELNAESLSVVQINFTPDGQQSRPISFRNISLK